MTFSSWRGVVGMINPTMRPGVTEEVIRLLPEGIGLIPLFLNVRRARQDEFRAMMPAYEKLIATLAEMRLRSHSSARRATVHGAGPQA
jgi:maleate isomerase